MKNKKYKLLKWFPTLPKDWVVGMELKKKEHSQYYSNINKKYPEQFLLDDEVENNPEFFEEIIKKEVLFVTEDGVEIFEGDDFVAVNKKEIRISGHNLKTKNISLKSRVWDGSDGYLQFSSVEKAQEWIVLNKPVLSLKDVSSIYPGINKEHSSPSHQAEQLKELVKSRL